jgi:hypothetical protein
MLLSSRAARTHYLSSAFESYLTGPRCLTRRILFSGALRRLCDVGQPWAVCQLLGEGGKGSGHGPFVRRSLDRR